MQLLKLVLINLILLEIVWVDDTAMHPTLIIKVHHIVIFIKLCNMSLYAMKFSH